MTSYEFPAQAGMNRTDYVAWALEVRVPRASGDEPAVNKKFYIKEKSSPRKRG